MRRQRKLGHCECGAKLPPYPGRGPRSTRCHECRRIARQDNRRRYERERYKNDPEFRVMKREINKKSRERKEP